MKKHKNKIIAGAVIAAVLAFVFWWGGSAPELRGWNPQKRAVKEEKSVPVEDSVEENKEADIPVTAAEKNSETEEKSIDAPSEKVINAEKKTENVPIPAESTKKDSAPSEDKQSAPPAESNPPNTQSTENSHGEMTCTMSVRCDTILKNIDWLAPEKAELVPKDGTVFAEQTVTFYEGESVFNLLVREMKRNKIHMEFENTPVYNSVYIEGIGNLYEFDCGELSGWMYKVNGSFPGCGCSQYQLKEGDRVEWVYTCDLGKDVGGYNAAGNRR